MVPGKGAIHTGPLVNIDGPLVVQDSTDLAVISQRLSFAVTSAGLGSLGLHIEEPRGALW